MYEIIIFSKEVEVCIDYVDEVQTILGEAGVVLNIKKVLFFTDSVDYVVHVIKSRQL